MNKINYDSLMRKTVAELPVDKKPKLLLHSCCAPCSSACIERLLSLFDITVYYCNPNIDTEEEFDLRAKEQKRLCEYFGVNSVAEKYDSAEFLAAVSGLEKEKEGGARCKECFYLRLKKTAEYAAKNGFDYFTTTLTISPLKNAEVLNETGMRVAEETGTKFLFSDFKKGGGYQRSIELSKELNLYRQNYCGCKFSKEYLKEKTRR